MASTTRPRARSFSAIIARGVGEPGQLAVLLELPELLEPDVHPPVVRYAQVEGRVGGVDPALEAGDEGPHDAFPDLVLVFLAASRELAVAPHAHPGAGAGVPDVALGGGGDVAVGVAHGPAALAQVAASALSVVHRPHLLHEVGGVCRGREGVTVVADLGVHVEIVE